jgi:hypothetical protein
MRCSLPRSFRVSSGESHSERQRIASAPPALRIARGRETARRIDDFATSVLENQSCKTAAEHLTDFDAPIYNVWKPPEQKQS